jgi:mannose-1-phosphate guanylyltransferase
MSETIHALIMAGGGGTRFWPRSRQDCPKQFLRLGSDRSLLQLAADRVESLVDPDHLWVITGRSMAQLVQEHLPQLLPAHLLGEPTGRDTAPCIALGAYLIAQQDPQAIMVVLPADHLIEPVQSFRKCLQAAAQLAREAPEALITLGVMPTRPATGYGYIRRGSQRTLRLDLPVYEIDGFREKPALETAQEYLATGQYYWNSGIFVWHVQAVLAALKRQQPILAAAVERIANSWSAPDRDQVFRLEYEALKRISIDHAVMEGCRQGFVLPAAFNWDDLGSWQALERLSPQDAHGNTIMAQHCGLNTRECIIVGDGENLIATVGIEQLLIVHDKNAVLVADRRDEAAVKQLVEHLKQSGWTNFL